MTRAARAEVVFRNIGKSYTKVLYESPIPTKVLYLRKSYTYAQFVLYFYFNV